ncbi:MAG: hypothetical protein KZQ83_00535 [gamma proteobacterium symbiont of Taylorina sp.]|nr:hypothetical protein [gamma proteobacterium symbiont of Taylorina sp.]
MQTQQTEPSINNQITALDKPLKVASVINGNVLLSSDKTHFLVPDDARHLGYQLKMAADRAEAVPPKKSDRTLLEDELKLISVSNIDANNQYTLTLTLHIKKPTESLTVAQLLQFHRECNERFNQGVSHG